MTIILDRKTFSEQFAAVAACCPSRTTNDVLKNVLLIADGSNALKLIAFDGEVCIQYKIDNIGEACKVLIPTARFLQILREVNEEKLELDVSEKDKLLVKSGNSTFNLQVADASAYPKTTEFSDSNYFRISTPALKHCIRHTIFATDGDSTRYALGGIQVNCGKDEITFAATDSHRLSVSHARSSTSNLTAQPVVAPRAAMKLLERSASCDETKIAVHPNDIAFESGPISITALLVTGRFPDYRKVIPRNDDIKSRVMLVAKHVAAIVRQANIATDEESRGIDLKFTKTELIVSSGAKEIGQAKVRMPISYEGEELTIKFDGRYVAEYLKTVGEQSIEIGLIDREDRVLFTVGDWQHVMMPMSKD